MRPYRRYLVRLCVFHAIMGGVVANVAYDFGWTFAVIYAIGAGIILRNV